MNKPSEQIQNALKRLERMENAIGSGKLSGVEVTSQAGKTAMLAIATAASREDFDAEAIRKNLSANLRM